MCDSPEWINGNKHAFENRLNEIRRASFEQSFAEWKQLDREWQDRNKPEQPKAGSGKDPKPVKPKAPKEVKVDLSGVSTAPPKKSASELHAGGITQGLVRSTQKSTFTSHEWLNCMDAFAVVINQVWQKTHESFRTSVATFSGAGAEEGQLPRPAPVATDRLEKDVVVALIDDGVDLVHPKFEGRVLEGKTFHYTEDGVGQYYTSAMGHGTQMAKLILQVCPMAKIYPSKEPLWSVSVSGDAKSILAVRLKTSEAQNGKIKVDVESAALVSLRA